MHHSIISLRIIWWTRKLRLWLGLGNEQPAGILVCSGPWQHNVSCGSKWLRGQRKWERTQASRSGRFSVLRFSWFLMSPHVPCLDCTVIALSCSSWCSQKKIIHPDELDLITMLTVLRWQLRPFLSCWQPSLWRSVEDGNQASAKVSHMGDDLVTFLLLW